MTAKEFSDSFDTRVGAWAQQAGFGDTLPDTLVFDEYEKSVFLTEGQDSLVLDYYEGNTAPAFEEKERTREALDALVDTYVTNTEVTGHAQFVADGKHLSKLFAIPSSLLYIIVEQATYGEVEACPRLSNKTVRVIPIKHDDYHRTLDNPFRGPSKNRILRLNATDNIVELISDYPIGSYTLRYVKQPNPIILVNLPEGVTIRNESLVSTGSLPDFLHEEILSRAVMLALRSRSYLSTKGERQQ